MTICDYLFLIRAYFYGWVVAEISTYVLPLCNEPNVTSLVFWNYCSSAFKTYPVAFENEPVRLKDDPVALKDGPVAFKYGC